MSTPGTMSFDELVAAGRGELDATRFDHLASAERVESVASGARTRATRGRRAMWFSMAATLLLGAAPLVQAQIYISHQRGLPPWLRHVKLTDPSVVAAGVWTRHLGWSKMLLLVGALLLVGIAGSVPGRGSRHPVGRGWLPHRLHFRVRVGLRLR